MFYLLLHYISFSRENNDIINMHTILLTKYEKKIQRRSNIYMNSPQINSNLTFYYHYA